MDHRVLFVFSLAICVAGTKGQTTRECDRDTLNMCRWNIDDVLLGNDRDETKKLDLEDQCWRVRQNFDCVLWQTSMCLNQDDQETNSNSILKAWRYLEGFCEDFKNWWTKRCYRSESLKKCDSKLPSKGRLVDKTSCRRFINFRECAISAIEDECSSEDQRYLGVFLMDKGQQRAWKCPKDETNYSDEPVNAPLASNSRNIMYSDSSSSVTCLYDAAKQVETCKAKFEGVKKTAKAALDKENMEEVVCCEQVKYENCIMKALKDHCGDDGAKHAKDIIQRFKAELNMKCEDHTESTCSAATYLTSASLALFISFLLSTFAMNIV